MEGWRQADSEVAQGRARHREKVRRKITHRPMDAWMEALHCIALMDGQNQTKKDAQKKLNQITYL